MRVLQEHELLHEYELAQLRRGREAHLQFAHQVMICDFLASIELGIRSTPGLRFISWRDILNSDRMPESTRRSPHPARLPVKLSYTFKNGRTYELDKPVEPDAIFGIGYPDGSFAFFALEADRATMPVERSNFERTSIFRKVLSYRQLVRNGTVERYLGLPNLRVLIVTTNDRNLQNIMRLVEELSADKRSELFLFGTSTTLGDFFAAPKPDGHMLNVAWRRAGYSDVYISRS